MLSPVVPRGIFGVRTHVDRKLTNWWLRYSCVAHFIHQSYGPTYFNTTLLRAVDSTEHHAWLQALLDIYVEYKGDGGKELIKFKNIERFIAMAHS